MSAFDENNYSINAYSVRSFKFSDVVSAIWFPIVNFNLMIVREVKLRLNG